MDWFYERRGQQNGPVSEEELHIMFQQGKLKVSTLVWNPELPEWIRYEDIRSKFGSMRYIPLNRDEVRQFCQECGKLFLEEDMLQFGVDWVCSGCKHEVFQRMIEGEAPEGDFVYGKFWYRAGAKLVDGVIVTLMTSIMQKVLLPLEPWSRVAPGEDPTILYHLFNVLSFVLAVGVPLLYSTWFIGKFAATPGKMLLNLKVVMPDGGRVGYARALLRNLAELLSYFAFLMGYVIAAFDDEHRTLHDRICNTRVVTS